jgi:hypothetical protein
MVPVLGGDCGPVKYDLRVAMHPMENCPVLNLGFFENVCDKTRPRKNEISSTHFLVIPLRNSCFRIDFLYVPKNGTLADRSHLSNTGNR